MSANHVFIIAELSANHGNSLEIIKKTIEAAKRAGADAIKLQTYKPETMTLDVDHEDFYANPNGIWAGTKLFDLYKGAALPWEWHGKVFELAKENGLVCFSSPFDKTAVDFLEKLNCPIYKIASFEITDIPLIKYAASKGKPMIISTGIANYDDIKLAIDTCRSVGNNDITILKCTTAYPAPPEEANLSMIQQFAEDFDVKVGLSDHTLGVTVPIAATVLGASVIEKHFILDRSVGGPDASFSLDEKEFTEMVQNVRIAEKVSGQVSYDLSEKQKESRKKARSLYVSQSINPGEIVTAENIQSVRPGLSLHPKHFDEIVGKKAKRRLEVGERISLEDFE